MPCFDFYFIFIYFCLKFAGRHTNFEVSVAVATPAMPNPPPMVLVPIFLYGFGDMHGR